MGEQQDYATHLPSPVLFEVFHHVKEQQHVVATAIGRNAFV